MNTTTLEHGKTYDLGATNATYDAHTDSFNGGNWSVGRSETIFKDAIGSTVKWYKLERDGEKVKIWQDGIVPTVWGEMNYRLYEYMPEIGAGKYNWVQIDGRLQMYSCNVKHFTYGNIPGSGKGWTLDVCAVSRTDANEYVKHVCRGGKFIGENVKAMCGATTQAAQERLRDALEAWMNETD